MKLTAVGKYYFSSDIRNFKNINPHIQFLRTSACVCRTSENCKSLVPQGECNIEIFLSPEGGKDQESIQSSTTPGPRYHMGK